MSYSEMRHESQELLQYYVPLESIVILSGIL